MSFLLDFTKSQFIDNLKFTTNNNNNIKLNFKNKTEKEIYSQLDEIIIKIINVISTSYYISTTLLKLISLQIIAYITITMITLGIFLLTISPILIYMYIIFKIVKLIL